MIYRTTTVLTSALATALLGTNIFAATSYTTSFEAPVFTASDAQNNIGALSGQGGWNGGASSGFTNDDFDIDNGDGTFGDEKITTAAAHTGSQSWRYSRGYDSSGQGTPFAPALDVSIGAPSSGADYDTMNATIWFKPVDSTGDGSKVNIYQGSINGDDRTGFNIYIESTSSGINVSTYRWNGNYASETIASNLALDQWHAIDINAIFTDDYNNDLITYTVDKGLASQASSTGNTWTHPWREANNFAYTPGNTLKFAAGHTDGNIAYKGFYFDDISFEATNSIPEPASLSLIALGSLALLRRKH